MKLIHCGPVAAAKGGLPGAVMGKRGEEEKGRGRRRTGPEVKW